MRATSDRCNLIITGNTSVRRAIVPAVIFYVDPPSSAEKSEVLPQSEQFVT
jgi:hypothetical protein